MRITERMCLVVVFLIGSQSPVLVGQQDYALALHQGTVDARLAVLKQALMIPPAARNEALWVAMVDELEAVASANHRRSDNGRAGIALERLPESWSDYEITLTQAVGQWGDLRALRPLISDLGVRSSTGAVLQFGEAAVQPLVDYARHGHRDSQGEIFRVLIILIEGSHTGITTSRTVITPTPLSSESISAIHALAKEMLVPNRVSPGNIGVLAHLALLTGDRDLYDEVELLAREPGRIAAYGGPDSVFINVAQRELRRLLQEHPRP